MKLLRARVVGRKVDMTPTFLLHLLQSCHQLTLLHPLDVIVDSRHLVDDAAEGDFRFRSRLLNSLEEYAIRPASVQLMTLRIAQQMKHLEAMLLYHAEDAGERKGLVRLQGRA